MEELAERGFLNNMVNFYGRVVLQLLMASVYRKREILPDKRTPSPPNAFYGH
jgi:hypothetical protein